MSAAVATRSQQPTPPHTTSSSSSTRMGIKSPADKKKNLSRAEDPSAKQSSNLTSTDTRPSTPPRTEAPSAVEQPVDPNIKKDVIGLSNAETTQPLAPPPRPAPQNASETPDYFSTVHEGSHLSLEPNPFEQSFGNPAVETPGKSILPPVASLTSPASLLRDSAASTGFNWPNSLRSGPLSPAMLTGPTGASDYFDSHLRGGFPTPNESSLRTGLTPGGGGSMFPAPSPSSQALFQQIANSGATPNTIDFHRTAMNAAAVRKHETDVGGASNLAATQSVDQDPNIAAVDVSHSQQPPAVQASDPFGQHDANDAANGLFLLAQARNGHPGPEQAAAARPPPTVPQRRTNVHMSAQPGGPVQGQQSSPTMGKKGARAHGGSLGGSISGSARGMSEQSGEMSESGAEEQEAKPNTQQKGKKAGNQNRGGQASNARRKADETPAKAPPAKKARASSGISMPDFNVDSEEDEDNKEEMLNEHGKKMTDEEKRKNFLERNRVAALKCRQRKKQWLANLQAKVEIFSSENDALTGQVTQLREEIVNLKTLLLAHKDCPVSQAQGIGGMGMNGMGGDFNHHSNPYGMAMANSGQVMAGQGMQRS